MGAARFLLMLWECLEHMSEQEFALVGCTSTMKDMNVIFV